MVLGDQPQIEARVIYDVLSAYAESNAPIVAPSYQMRRGHPILIDRRYWNDLLNLPRNGSPRDVINEHKEAIHYVNVDTDSVLRDVDTPQDYAHERWRAGLK
jgi:molybdenum cofactor cytidylyltransferase